MHLMHHQILATETMQIQQQHHHQNQQQPQSQVAQSVNHHHHKQQQQQQLQANEDHQHLSAPSMTVLETLEPVLSVLDPMAQQQQQQHLNQQQDPLHGQHLVQAPQLHQLQAPSRNQLEQQQMDSSEDIGGEANNDNNNTDSNHNEGSNHNNNSGNNHIRSSGRQAVQQQRSHIEGIVADGGGPIVQWLLDNYEIADGESLPRSTVYNHYLAHCRHLQMASVNAASFGKLIRSVFVGLKTRRLGTRGHSKYHYFGVRAKQHVRLDWLQEAADTNELGGSSVSGPGCSAHDTTNENSNQNTDNGSESSPESTGDEHHSSHNSTMSNKRLRRHHHHHHNHHFNNNHHHHHHTRRAANTCVGTSPVDNYGHQLDEQQQQLHNNHHHHEQLHHNLNQQQQQQQPHNHQQQLQLHHHQQHSHHNNQVNPHNHSSEQMLEHLCHQQVNANGYYYTNGCSTNLQMQQPDNGYNGVQQVQEGAILATGNMSHKLTSNGPLNSQLAGRFVRTAPWPPADHDELATYRSHLASNWSTLVDEHWPHQRELPSRPQLWAVFEDSYRAYYKRMLELLNELRFADVEQLWLDFWHPTGPETDLSGGSAPASTTTPPVTTTTTTTMAQANNVGARQPQLVTNQPATVHWTASVGQQQQQETTIQNNGHHVELVVQCQDQMDSSEPGVNPLHQHNNQPCHHHHQPAPSEDHLYQASDHHHNLHQVVVLENSVGENCGQQQQQQQQGQQPIGASGLSFNQLYQLTGEPSAIERINQIDYCLYAALEFFLVPDLLGPVPRPLAQQLRMFAKCFGPWMELATRDYGHPFSSEKSKSARAFGHALRRYTSINHLATASRAVWDKRPVLAQMSLDLGGIDLRDIEHQVSLMSQAKLDQRVASDIEQSVGENESAALNDVGDAQRANTNLAGAELQQQQHQEGNGNENASMETHIIHPDNRQLCEQKLTHEHQHDGRNLNQTPTRQLTGGITTNHNHPNKTDQLRQTCPIQPAQLIQNFLHLLQDPYPADNWPAWCRNLVQYCGHSVDDARNFILKWNFYISLIMKELTLKSAPSLGSFQLIRLLFDEYIYYLVASKLARAQNKTFAQLLQASSCFDGV